MTRFIAISAFASLPLAVSVLATLAQTPVPPGIPTTEFDLFSFLVSKVDTIGTLAVLLWALNTSRQDLKEAQKEIRTLQTRLLAAYRGRGVVVEAEETE
jgi:hypothetical protein